jgi:flagellin-like hook-associated protein FlgL
MPLIINTNAAAVTANFNSSRNNGALQKRLYPLSSGRRMNQTSDAPGSLIVSMKLSASIKLKQRAPSRIQNSTLYLEVQDGALKGAAGIISRMAELKSLSQDVHKNESDIANYNAEFKNFQVQLYQIGQETFNGVSLFAIKVPGGTTDTVFEGGATLDNTVSICAAESGSAGPFISFNKAFLLNVITFDVAEGSTNRTFGTLGEITLAAQTSEVGVDLSTIAVSFFTQALVNIATLRAENECRHQGLTLIKNEQAKLTEATLKAVNSRIMDAGIAAGITNLTK